METNDINIMTMVAKSFVQFPRLDEINYSMIIIIIITKMVMIKI